MGRTAPAIPLADPPKGIVLELITSSRTWAPPAGVKSVMLELIGGGQGGEYNIGNPTYGGQSGEYIYTVVHGLLTADTLSIVIGTGGTPANSSGAGRTNGGATTVTVKGTTYTARGGGQPGNVNGAKNPHTQAGAAPGNPTAYSILLGMRNDLGGATAIYNGAGGYTPLGSGGTTTNNLGPGELGAGGAINQSGGNGYVLAGYYLP